MQQRGLDMMFRGTIHLLCYRLIYHELLIPASKVHDPLSLAVYLVCNYLLYLQVSGQFHMAAGMLHLFGFQLPQTHHHYLLATSFTDYWRRINIYWKDFMVRLFFNPVVFRLKRWPQPLALAIATCDRLRGHLVPACLPVVLAARKLGFHGSRRPVLGNLGRPGPGQRAARRPSQPGAGAEPGGAPADSRSRSSIAQSRGNVHHRYALVVALVQPEPLGLAGDGSSRDFMDHEPIMTRQFLVMILILLCGIVPDRLAGRTAAASLRDSFKSNLFNRADLERIERGYYEELLDQGHRLDDLADVPGLACTLAIGQHLVDPRRSIAAGRTRG